MGIHTKAIEALRGRGRAFKMEWKPERTGSTGTRNGSSVVMEPAKAVVALINESTTTESMARLWALLYSANSTTTPTYKLGYFNAALMSELDKALKEQEPAPPVSESLDTRITKIEEALKKSSAVNFPHT